MKLKLFPLGFLAFMLSCSIGSVKKEKAIKLKHVPSEVVEAFFKRHPEASSNFHKQKVNGTETYEAHFMNRDKEFSERFTSHGVLIETEAEIDFHSIPDDQRLKIQSYLNVVDKDHKLIKVQYVKADDFQGYELKVDTEKSRTGLMEYFFRPDGSFDHQEELELKAIPTLY